MSSLSAGRPSARAGRQGIDVRDLVRDETARINFEVPRELRQAFKAWAAQHDTSIKDELTRHIAQLVEQDSSTH